MRPYAEKLRHAFDSPAAPKTTSRPSFAVRFVETLRSECLDWIIVLSRSHLNRVLGTYAAH